jgi:2-amino-4-hydroxy-6-hydroxymethyldihydropteridine diphosphokinase
LTVPEVIIALGANADNPEAQIMTAIGRLEAFAEDAMRVSSLWRSEPVAMNDDSGVFVNAVVAFQTLLPAQELLAALQGMEVEMGRPTDHGKNVARSIDLDILTYGAELISEPNLQVPHPRMSERLFVLLTLQEIKPDFVLPGGRSEVQQLIQAAEPIEISRL